MSDEFAEEYRFGHSPEELNRLREQHEIWAEHNQRLLARAEFAKGATLVDLGCGPGFTTMDLAEIAGPNGRVIGVDRDGERSLSLLLHRAEQAGRTNIETRVANLETFALEENSVDGVYGRWVLMYLPEHSAAELVTRAARWLRPGGSCVYVELCNFHQMTAHPPMRSLPAVTEAFFRAARGSRGCNPEIGTLLPGLLHSAGLEVEINVVTKAVRATTPGWRWPDGLFRGHLPTFAEEGLISKVELEAFWSEWEQQSQDPGAIFFGSPVMEVVAKRS